MNFQPLPGCLIVLSQCVACARRCVRKSDIFSLVFLHSGVEHQSDGDKADEFQVH